MSDRHEASSLRFLISKLESRTLELAEAIPLLKDAVLKLEQAHDQYKQRTAAKIRRTRESFKYYHDTIQQLVEENNSLRLELEACRPPKRPLPPKATDLSPRRSKQKRLRTTVPGPSEDQRTQLEQSNNLNLSNKPGGPDWLIVPSSQSFSSVDDSSADCQPTPHEDIDSRNIIRDEDLVTDSDILEQTLHQDDNNTSFSTATSFSRPILGGNSISRRPSLGVDMSSSRLSMPAEASSSHLSMLPRAPSRRPAYMAGHSSSSHLSMAAKAPSRALAYVAGDISPTIPPTHTAITANKPPRNPALRRRSTGKNAYFPAARTPKRTTSPMAKSAGYLMASPATPKRAVIPFENSPRNSPLSAPLRRRRIPLQLEWYH